MNDGLQGLNPVSLDTLCGALACAMGIEPPAHAAAANETLTAYVDEKLGGARCDRILMYNPDAVGEWIYRKYAFLLREVTELSELELPLRAVMPSVTPVCFGTMYTGAQPEVHGIRRYEKPVIKIDTLFDALVRAGKRVAIVAEKSCSMSMIFCEREIDYFIYDTIGEIDARAAELIMRDEHDVIVVYHGNYDGLMHKYGPESPEALSELRANAHAFAELQALVRAHWQSHRTLMGFAMDHGAHEIDGGCGSHGLDMPEDLNILHRYQIIGG